MLKQWLVLFTLLWLVSPPVVSKVYRCSGAYGDEYRDVPCNENQEKRQSAEYKVGSGVISRLSLRTLSGVWCNYAKSNSISGTRDYSDPDRWELGMDGQLEIQDLDQFSDNASSRFRLHGRSIHVSERALGRMAVADFTGDEMVLLGDTTYLFMRRGGCPEYAVDQDVASASPLSGEPLN
ncbi:hypothetical protein ACFSJ3_09355 [Corallincola platygyrae]|uniref:Uncharacterized protein n=1 Tax=Corallincola platygyrae TaxID=1193278 RepID=A0ABW4XM35_9GAMM